jgi:ferric-dicitrate binding protein FerR (iron transport regulator)
MIMEKDQKYFEGLIARYLSGEADPREVSELSRWTGLDPLNARMFRESQEAWMLAEAVRIEETLDVEKALERTRERTKDEGRRTRDEGRRTNTQNPLTTNHQPPTTDHQPPTTDHQPLTTDHLPLTRTLWPSSWLLRAAAIFLLLAMPSYFIYQYLNRPAIMELAASSGRIDTELPDGSKVTLNTGAVIRYPENFKGKKRSLDLSGEAYFDVAHDALKPFVITSDGIRVEVKGTSFYINTRMPDGSFELILTTGRVELSAGTDPGHTIVIMPGEKASVRGTDISVSANEDPNYMAWKTMHISFSNDPLDLVVSTLEKVYGKKISLVSPGLAGCRLTATFDRQSLESVLNVLQATLDVEIRNSGTLVEISGKGCN